MHATLLRVHCFRNIFCYSSKAGWHSICLFTLERGQLEMCQRESDQERQQDLVLCGEFTTSRKITLRRAHSVRRVLPADTKILTCKCSRGWTARWWRCLGLARKGHASYFWHQPQTWFLRWCFAAREVRKCVLNKNTQKTSVIFSCNLIYTPAPSFWLPLCTPHCHRYVRFGPSWPGTAGQRRCRASPRSLGSSSWTPSRHWSGGWGVWLAALCMVKMV